MYTVTGTAPSGLDFTQKYESVQNAYTIARSWIGFGYLNVALMEDGGQWYRGPEQIRQFIEGVELVGNA